MRTLLISLFFLSFTLANAQKLSLEEAETQTYNSIISNDYKSTIKLGNEALKQGIDSYYIRYRLGISYFTIKNYEAAITQFENAKSIDSNDPALLEYLYYAYVFSNRIEKAQNLSEIFPDDLKAKINSKQKVFKSISMEVGMLQTNNFKNFNSSGILGNNAYAQGTFYSDVLFGNIIITNQVSKNLKLENIISVVSNTSNNMFQLKFPTIQTQVFTDKNNYIQWNAIGTYYLRGWHIGAGFGLYDSSYITYTPPTNFPANQTFTSEKTTNINYSGSLSISKHLKYFEPTLGISYTDLSDSKTICADGAVTYFPFGNLNFYGNSKIGYVKNNSESNTIYSQLLGAKLAKKVWIEGYGAYGNHLNYITENGLFAFNTPNKINWYAGANLNLYFKKIDITLGYGMQERAASYYTELNPTTSNTVNYTYNYNLFKTKIVWKF
jgi:hypothetical protein